MEMDLTNKYHMNIDPNELRSDVQRLTNQLWKLIPMRENGEDWRKQLNTVTLEIAGLNEIFETSHFLALLAKLEGLRVQETDFELYRKTIFEGISILQRLKCTI